MDGFSSRSKISTIFVPMKVFPAPGGPWIILTRFFRTCCSAYNMYTNLWALDYTDTVLQNMLQCLQYTNLWALDYALTVPGSSEHSAVPTIYEFLGPRL